MEKLCVRTECQVFYIARYDGLKFKIGEIGVDTFCLKYLAVVKKKWIKPKGTVFSIKECKNRLEYFLEVLLDVDPSRNALKKVTISSKLN